MYVQDAPFQVNESGREQCYVYVDFQQGWLAAVPP
jgi:hypothetical protein